MEASATAAQRLYDVAYGDGRFVAVGADDNGIILHSADANQWTASSDTAITNRFGEVAHGATHFIAIALNNDPPSSKIVRSTDGTTWNEATDTDIPGYIGDVAYGANRFVAVGDAGKIIHSPDGDRWTDATTATATRLRGVASNGRRFVAVGDNGTILTSP